jgi:hypothetical protein
LNEAARVHRRALAKVINNVRIGAVGGENDLKGVGVARRVEHIVKGDNEAVRGGVA